ncbi:DUF4412 domain-containing protein [uncultured Ilyobacter sp.]|uniref:DUF4412 domain-containing protein n=1 Tax=uncultured Ilyobacter sp. TaxID=544433 RepID=UPI0029F481DA|nr:DUF4412 domain-containing protein [uncultured Ilyobacter sp.]
MIKRKLLILMLFLISLSLISVFSYGDVYTKQKKHVDGMNIMGRTQPARDFVVETWISPERVSVEDENSKTVIDFDKNIIRIADHNEKTIMSMPMNFSEIIDQKSSGISKDESAEFKKFMGKMMQVSVSVKETGEKKKIGKWNCTKYIQVMRTGMGEFKSEIWATEDIDIDRELYAKYISAMKGTMPGMNENMKEILKETKKIRGMEVYAEQTTEMMGQTMRSSTELLEYKKGKAPATAFEMPSGYKNVEF